MKLLIKPSVNMNISFFAPSSRPSESILAKIMPAAKPVTILGKQWQQYGFAVFDALDQKEVGCLILNVNAMRAEIWLPSKIILVSFSSISELEAIIAPVGTWVPKSSWPCHKILQQKEQNLGERVRVDCYLIERLYYTLDKEVGIDQRKAFRFAQKNKLPYFSLLTACDLDLDQGESSCEQESSESISPTLSIAFLDDNIFCKTLQSSPALMSTLLEDVYRKYEQVINLQYKYNPATILGRLVEQGVTPEKCMNMFTYQKEIILAKVKELKQRKFVILSCLLEVGLPKDVVSIVTAYIPWFGMIELSFNQKLLLEQLGRIIFLEGLCKRFIN